MIIRLLSLLFLVPSWATAVSIDLAAELDRAALGAALNRALPIGQRHYDERDRTVMVNGAVELRLPSLDNLSRGRFLRDLQAILRGDAFKAGMKFDFDRADVNVVDHSGGDVAWRGLAFDPATVVRVPWPVSLFYPDRLGRILKDVLPKGSYDVVGVNQWLRVRGTIVFDVSAVPESLRGGVEAHLRHVLAKPKSPGVRDPVDASAATIGFGTTAPAPCGGAFESAAGENLV